MDHSRRKFLRTAWGAVIVFGGGLIGFPLGCKPGNGEGDILTPADLKDLGLSPEDLARAPELTDQEVKDFIEEVDARAADADAAGDLTDDAGNPKVPPGQHVVEAMIVMASNPNPRSLEEWRFHVQGEVENPLEFTWEQFQDLPHVELVASVSCVTGWTALDIPWGGVRFPTLYGLAGLTDKANFVISDCEHNYTTNVDIAETYKDNVLIGTMRFGGPLEQKYGGPARGVIPDRYFYKSGKWLTGLRILEKDEPGFWETRGYSNTADIWTEDRYA